MISLKTLKFSNIGRFVEEQIVDFNNLQQIVEVKAINKNTGGSSGSGKSTVFHAVDYLLGINDIPATALQTRLKKDAMAVEGFFVVDGVNLTIKRSKKEGLYIKFGEEEISGNVKLAEERLEQIIGIPKKLFKKMVHKKQKEGGFFLNLTAKESYQFLMNALGLEKTNNKTYKIEEDIKKYTQNIGDLSSDIEYDKKSIEELKDIINTKQKPKKEYTDEDLEKLKIKTSEAIDKKELLKKEYEEKIKVIDKPIKQCVKIDPNPEIIKLEEELNKLDAVKEKRLHEYSFDIKQCRDAKSEFEKKLSNIPFYKKQLNDSISEMERLVKQKKQIETNRCPTCNQEWSNEESQKKIEEISIKIKEIRIKILENKNIVDSEKDLKEKLNAAKARELEIEEKHSLNDINLKYDSIKQKIIELKSDEKGKTVKIENEYLNSLNEYNENIKKLEMYYENNLIEETNKQIEELKYQIHTVKSSIENYDKLVKDYDKDKEQINKKIKAKQTNLEDLEHNLTQTKYKLEVAEEARRALKNYTLRMFQETLDYIGICATNILSDIPSMSNTTVYFEGCKENKSGSIKDEVNAIINMDGYNDVNIKTLSGGERTAIDLAVDLAVIDMIESKAGKGADFFILDEPFDGLEDINIAQCLEVLRKVDMNKKIIIVDHNPIATEMISDRITVERNGEESVVL